MWNAASTVPRATSLIVATVLTLLALVVSAAVDATPKAPGELTVTGATENSLSLSWTSARGHGDHTITGYHVYLDGTLEQTESGADLVDGTSFQFVSLRCGTTYTFGVEAVDDAGATSRIGAVRAATSSCPSETSTPPTEASSSATPSSTDPSAGAAPATATSSSGAMSFGAVADARVDESQPDTELGTRQVLRVDGGSSAANESYLRFDVSGLSGSVTSAKLRVYATSRTADGPAAYSAPNDWSESAITWNNRPVAVGSAADDIGAVAANSWAEWNVTKLVTGNGTYSFVLVGNSSDGVAMSSRESGVSPQLVVSTDASGDSGSGTDTTPPGAPTDLSVVSRTTSVITVSWNASPDVGVTGYDLLLDGAKTGETTSLSASFGPLACGHPYTVGVRAFDAAGIRSNALSLATGTLACTQPPAAPGTGGVNWFPGYYVLAHDMTNHQKILDDPLVAPFTGVQFRYYWAATELAPHDYSAGFAALDADLKAAAAKSKKLLVMLQYKKNDGTPAVPADLLRSPGPWCSARYCGEFVVGSTHLAMVWNPAVDARLQAWIAAMAAHAAASPYASSLAGVVFNETSLPGGTTDTTVLSGAGYDPYEYMKGLQNDMQAATAAAPRLPVFYYHEGGFVSMDGKSVHAGQVMGDWMLQHPHTGTGTPDLKPKSPKTTSHPCAIAAYQGRIPCAPAIEAGDYSTSVTSSLDQSIRYAFDPAPDGLHASFLTFSYAVGSGPNAFTLADASRYVATHPSQNTALPPGW